MAGSKERFDALVAQNQTVAQSWTTPPKMVQMRESQDGMVLVVSCIDSRASPDRFFGQGKSLPTFRNAGGRYTADLVRSVNVLRTVANKAKDMSVFIVHHTDCGMLHVTNDEVRADIKKRNPAAAAAADQIDFGACGPHDLEKSILEDVAKFKAEPLLKGVDVYGYVLTTEEGTLKKVA